MIDFDRLPQFEPHPLLAGGHAQTLAAVYLPGPRRPYRAVLHRVTLEDGDQIVLHDDCPSGWQPGGRAALLIHGLAGCHRSGYMERTAAKLNARGVRTFRMDLRGCGAGTALARLPYHAGRSEDAAAALRYIAGQCPQSPTTLVGFSLGGNIALKLLGELKDEACGHLDGGVAVCPPIDLASCSRQIREPRNRIYNRHLVGLLLRQLRRRCRTVPGAAVTMMRSQPKTLWELDDTFTAEVCGFGTAENYYHKSSSAPLISRIRRPTLILASRDDPLIPCQPLEELTPPPAVRLEMTRHGGHLGYIARLGADPDRRWMDWRIVDWVTSSRRSP